MKSKLILFEPFENRATKTSGLPKMRLIKNGVFNEREHHNGGGIRDTGGSIRDAGLGVAFTAVPFLSLFLPDIINMVQPLTLQLNGFIALFAMLGFACSGLVVWRKAIPLAVVTMLSAPVGAWLAHYIPLTLILGIYFLTVIFLAYTLFRSVKEREEATENFRAALILAVSISILAGILGIGSGFLLIPTLILLGFAPIFAAGMNAFAVTPPLFQP